MSTAWHRIRGMVAGLVLAALPGLAGALETSLTAPGAPDDLADRLRGASAAISADARGVSEPQELLAAALSDYRTLVEVLYDQGYFGPVVNIRIDGREAAYIPPLNPPARIGRIDITVTAGRAFRFGRAEVAPLAPDTELPDDFRPGAPATTGLLRDAARAGIAGWQRAGHAKAEVGSQRIVANHRDDQLDAEIRLLPGPRLSFGRMRVTSDSQSRVREEAIHRIAGFPTGQQFHPDEVQKAGARLRRTGAFASVSLAERDQPNPDGTLDFDATVVDGPPRRLTFGAEVSSNEGLDLSFLWMHRNLFGGAERFRLETRVRNLGGNSNPDGAFTLRLDRPAHYGPDWDQFYLIDVELLDEEHYRSLRAIAALGVKRTFSDNLFAEAFLGPGYSRADDAFSKAAGLDYREFHYLLLSTRAEWDMRDNGVDATSGFYLDARLTPFAGYQQTASGMHMRLDGRYYHSLTQSGSVVLAGRMQLGSVLGASLQGVPPEMLFFSGGAGSVRGQPYQSLGSMLVGTEVAGGRSLINLSAEIRGRVTEKISVVGFYDYGIVGADAFVDTNSPTHSGAGLGVRYDLGGLGPLRFDVGFPVSGLTNDGVQFYLGIGQAF